MAVDLSAITTNVNTLSNLALVTPKKNIGIRPQLGNNGQSATQSILFDIVGEETSTLSSDVTDHYVEDNTAIQDQVALKPVTISVQGYIGELNNVPPTALEPLKEIADKLSVVGAYVPVLTAAALIAYNNAVQLYATAKVAANSAVQAWNTITAGNNTLIDAGGILKFPVQNRQQIAFTQFFQYWKARQLFTVQTPWAIFEDMIIMSLRATQNEDTRVITDFEITFKQMRFAKTVINTPSQAQGRLISQASKVVDQGTTTGINTTQTVAGIVR